MKSTPSCLPCYLKQALSAIKEITEDRNSRYEILKKVSRILPELTMDKTPAFNSTLILQEVSKITGIKDPFLKKKEYYNQLSLAMYPRLKDMVKNSEDHLETATKIAVAGNVIDLGILGEVNLEKSLKEIFTTEFRLNHIKHLKNDLKRLEKVLYLGDNAGEILFDRILVEEFLKMDKKVIFAVKEAPVLNDATLKDAAEVELDTITKVISTGSDKIGTDLESCSEEFLDIFYNSDIIISKGQGNFETLNEENLNIYFILKAKCDEVANELGVNMGDIVIVNNKYLN
ncbi:hypothetical protein DRQ09_03985 [candidate division KSB1 bacterium]|nr:MAG: hypothetical protein DRQ09_03985 [candidate division KSB1 bacterium]